MCLHGWFPCISFVALDESDYAVGWVASLQKMIVCTVPVMDAPVSVPSSATLLRGPAALGSPALLEPSSASKGSARMTYSKPRSRILYEEDSASSTGRSTVTTHKRW